ncbi:DUF4157 domain-containing protein [Spirulina major CS-329]|uniref:eCIS core domain-containing protein n=1 Tax=Spirulina TaxID=1154 RepID=UPI00232BA460|nr:MULTISPECIES: DUF4157 domain-containing protein [Spirulina]MDB9494044.1 DUF4157 domain-containing protein [Spirulina subsalsa CS-330]MDB9504439.1 DUF4157 domain-containing protein [Spirulina major CS-329]
MAKNQVQQSRPFVPPVQKKASHLAPSPRAVPPSVVAVEGSGLLPVQAKLTLGEVGDRYEQEADATAKQVVQAINAPTVQTKSTPIQPVGRNLTPSPLAGVMQAQGNLGGGAVAADVETGIQRAKGGGQSLDTNLQESMGQAMGADFSNVRIHTNGQSDQLNTAIQAKAFTTGQDVFFRQGEYNPNSTAGQELIAHELTHVVQQSGGSQSVQKQESQVNNLGTLQDLYKNYLTFNISCLQKVYDLHNKVDQIIGDQAKKSGKSIPPKERRNVLKTIEADFDGLIKQSSQCLNMLKKIQALPANTAVETNMKAHVAEEIQFALSNQQNLASFKSEVKDSFKAITTIENQRDLDLQDMVAAVQINLMPLDYFIEKTTPFFGSRKNERFAVIDNGFKMFIQARQAFFAKQGGMSVVDQIKMILSLKTLIEQGLVEPCSEYIKSFGEDTTVSSLLTIVFKIHSKLLKPANIYKEIQEPPVYMEGIFETLKDIKGSIEDYQSLIDNFEHLAPEDLEVDVTIKPPSLQEGQGEKVKIEDGKQSGGSDRQTAQGQEDATEIDSTQYFLTNEIMTAAEFEKQEAAVFDYKMSNGDHAQKEDYIQSHSQMINILQEYEKFRDQNSKGISNLTDALNLLDQMSRITGDYWDCISPKEAKDCPATCARSIYSNIEDESDKLLSALKKKSSADNAQDSSTKNVNQNSATSGEGSSPQKNTEVEIKQPKTQAKLKPKTERKLPSPKGTLQQGEMYDNAAEKHRQFGTQIMLRDILIKKLNFIPGKPVSGSYEQSTFNLNELAEAMSYYHRQKTKTDYDSRTSIRKLLPAIIDIINCCEAAYPEFDPNGKNDPNTQDVIRHVYDQAFKEQTLLFNRIETLTNNRKKSQKSEV